MTLNAKQQRRIDTAPASWRGILTRAITGKGPRSNAIRAQCGECNGFDRDAIRNCNADACPLYAYRPGSKRRANPVKSTTPTAKAAFPSAEGANMPFSIQNA